MICPESPDSGHFYALRGRMTKILRHNLDDGCHKSNDMYLFFEKGYDYNEYDSLRKRYLAGR